MGVSKTRGKSVQVCRERGKGRQAGGKNSLPQLADLGNPAISQQPKSRGRWAMSLHPSFFPSIHLPPFSSSPLFSHLVHLFPQPPPPRTPSCLHVTPTLSVSWTANSNRSLSQVWGWTDSFFVVFMTMRQTVVGPDEHRSNTKIVISHLDQLGDLRHGGCNT